MFTPRGAASIFGRLAMASGVRLSEEASNAGRPHLAGSLNGSGRPSEIIALFGAWRSLVARTVRVGEVPGSNPGAPIG
jgi:hypothetical protein